MQGLLRKRAVLGLDLGAGAVKAVEWAHGSIRAHAFASLSAEQGGDAHATGTAIREILRDAASGAGRAVLGLSAGEVLMHQFRLPGDLPAPEIEEQARIQAAQAAPYPASEACYDYRPEGAGEQQVSYRMLIARSSVVRALCRKVEKAGIKVAAVDLTCFAVQRALAARAMQGSAWAVLDGGHSATRLSVYREGRLAFQHSQPFGCRELAGRLQRTLGLTPNETRRAIEDCRLPGGALDAIRNSFLEDLGRHATRALQLVLASGHEAPVPERIYFWGGSALVHGACSALSKALGIPVEAADPWQAAAEKMNAPGYSPVLLGAYALAINDHA